MGPEGESATAADSKPEAPANTGVPAAAPSNPLMNVQTVAQASAAAAAQDKGQLSTADETGLEDQAWVEKARVIISRSSGDPFVRHDALNQLKYQYLKQRFGKDIGGQSE